MVVTGAQAVTVTMQSDQDTGGTLRCSVGRACEAVADDDRFQGLSPGSMAQRDQQQQQTGGQQKLVNLCFLKKVFLFLYARSQVFHASPLLL